MCEGEERIVFINTNRSNAIIIFYGYWLEENPNTYVFLISKARN